MYSRICEVDELRKAKNPYKSTQPNNVGACTGMGHVAQRRFGEENILEVYFTKTSKSRVLL